ncbi:MAG: helix-turn-helix domain-containing protein [Cyanobacteriota bacterium]
MGASSLARQLVRWPRRFRPGASGPTPPPAAPPDPFRIAGQTLRDSREAKGLRLRDLAERTRISIAVLEALEGGWKDRLPEAPYLRTMLPLLEQALELSPGSLEALLPLVPHGGRAKPAPQGLAAAVFSPFTVHFLTRWQGTVLYGLLILALLFAVNQQQRRLAALGRLSSRPVPLVVGSGGPAAAGPATASSIPPQALHPLSRAAAGVALDLLARDSRRQGEDRSPGALGLMLREPTRLELRGPGGEDWRVDSVRGDLSLPMVPPFELRLRPAPPAGAVRWRGRPLAPLQTAADALYAVPTPAR